jgi:hypothetical protein
MIYFTAKVGPTILIFGSIAALAAWTLIRPPFPFAFLFAALFPPAIGGGVYMAMAGIYMPWAFLAPLPLSWLFLAASVGHRRLMREGYFHKGASNAMIFLYIMTFLNINLFYYAGLYSYYSLFLGLLSLLAVFHLLRLFRSERDDPVPAISLSMMLYFAAGIVLSLTIVI